MALFETPPNVISSTCLVSTCTAGSASTTTKPNTNPITINAYGLKLAKFFENHPKIESVNYPNLENNKYNTLAKKYLPKGTGGMLGFGIKGGFEAGSKFIDSLKLLINIANLGDTRTLVIHPASTTHQQMSEEDRRKCGIENDFIRMSVGISRCPSS